MDDAPAPRVLVVGGGYAGVMAARAARRHGACPVLLDVDGTHELRCRYAAGASGRDGPSDATAHLADLAGVEVRTARVVSVEAERDVVVDAEGGRHPYDALVLASGARAAAPPITGLAEHAHDVHDAAGATALRAALAETTGLVVAGGGPTGVQVAGEAAAAQPGLAVTLVEPGGRLLAGMPASLARRAGELLDQRGVDVRLGSALAAVEPGAARLDDGTRVPGLVAWAGGFAAAPPGLPDAPRHDGRLVVDAALRVPGHPRVLAAGDVAAAVDARGRTPAMSAQVAVLAGAAAGVNAARIARGRAPRPVTLRELGRVVDLGAGRGVAQVGPLALATPPLDRLAPLLHEAIDLRHLWRSGGLRALRRYRRGAAAPAPPAAAASGEPPSAPYAGRWPNARQEACS
ncbi:MAG: FAD-dependent oxidoreductase [Egibacteraceae bacterium]